MKISELIVQLAELQAKHGDLQVAYPNEDEQEYFAEGVEAWILDHDGKQYVVVSSDEMAGAVGGWGRTSARMIAP